MHWHSNVNAPHRCCRASGRWSRNDIEQWMWHMHPHRVLMGHLCRSLHLDVGEGVDTHHTRRCGVVTASGAVNLVQVEIESARHCFA
jgi:hypothetical protein